MKNTADAAKRCLKNMTPGKKYGLGFAVLLLLWMASGLFSSETPPSPSPEKPPLVQTKKSTGEVITRLLTLQGQIIPDKAVTLRSELGGVVERRAATEGEPVAKNDTLVRLTTDDRQARLREAEASVKQFELEYQSAKKLGQQGFQAKNRVAGVLAELEKAKARLATIREEINKSIFRAPFAGILQEIYLEEGDAVTVGTEVARVLSIDPLVLEGYIPQNDIENVPSQGRKNKARGILPNGQELTGHLRYVSAEAHPQTRTYRVEVAVPNPDNRPLAGSSVTLEIPLSQVMTHSLSPAYLSLNEDGTLGVKVLGDNQKAEFVPVEIEKTTTDKIWVSGLDEQTTLITLGHGFVKDGEPVRTQKPEETKPEEAEPEKAKKDSLR